MKRKIFPEDSNVWTEIKLCQMDTQMQLNILWIWATEHTKRAIK